MKIQVNSDKTIAVDTTLMRLVEAEVSRILGRFAIRLTRVEIHLSDIGDRKTGHAANRCLIEVRPAGARPLSTMAKSTKIESSVSQRRSARCKGRSPHSSVELEDQLRCYQQPL
jgi:hypothetical protein